MHDYLDPDSLPPLVQLILEFLFVFRFFLFSKRLLFQNRTLKYRLSLNSGNIANFLSFLAI